MIRIKNFAALLAICIAFLGIASIFPYLDMVGKGAAVAGVAAALLTVRRRALLAGSLPTVLSIAAFVAYGVRFSAADPITPAVNLLTILLAVRLAGERSVRHHLQVAVLSLFILAASSLFNLGPVFLLYLVLMLVLIAVSLVVLSFCTAEAELLLTRGQLKRVLSVALLIPAGTIPLILLFFTVMPRTQYPLWNFLNQAPVTTTGMSEEVRPGSTPSVVPVRTLAFRAAMPEIDKNLLYWRGIVLNSLRDNSWHREDLPWAGAGTARGGSTVSATILPEPQRGKYLVTLDLPVSLDGPIRVRHHADLVFSMPAPVEKRIRYEVVAVPGGVLTVGRSVDRAFYLQLPDNVPSRVRALGERIGRGRDAADKLVRAEEFFRTAPFRYTTSGLPTGEGALDTFLFEQRLGHCELFASSLAVLLRVAGVPCRLVGGYYGGSYNDIGGYYMVTEDMAHLWVEAFVDGKGWVRVDPSAWSSGFGPQERGETRFAGTLRLWGDALAYSWNMAVISYDLERQIRLFSETGERVRRADAKKAAGMFVAVTMFLLAAGAAVVMLRRHRWRSREERIVEQFLTVLRERHGVRREDSSTGLHDLAAQAGSEAAKEFVAIYSGSVYRDRKLSDKEYRRLRELLKLM